MLFWMSSFSLFRVITVVTLALYCMIGQYVVMPWEFTTNCLLFCSSELCSCCNRISIHEGGPLS